MMTPFSHARRAWSALYEGEGPRAFYALGKRQARSRQPSPLPCPLPWPPQHELHAVLAGFPVEEDALDGSQSPPFAHGHEQGGMERGPGLGTIRTAWMKSEIIGRRLEMPQRQVKIGSASCRERVCQ